MIHQASFNKNLLINIPTAIKSTFRGRTIAKIRSIYLKTSTIMWSIVGGAGYVQVKLRMKTRIYRAMEYVPFLQDDSKGERFHSCPNKDCHILHRSD